MTTRSLSEGKPIGTGVHLLETLQKALLCALIILVTHRFYNVLWLASTRTNLLEEMRAFAVFLGDYPLILLCIVSFLRLLVDAPYRASLAAFALKIVERGSGASWFALVVWMGLAILWAREPIMVRYGTLHFIAELLMAIVLAEFVSRGWLQSACWAIVAGTTAQGLLAMAQSIHQGPLGLPFLNESPLILFSYYRSFGLTINPNNLAGYLVCGFFVALILMKESRASRFSLYLPLGCCLIILGGLLATQSRAAIVGLILGAVFIALLQPRKPLSRRAVFIFLVSLILVGIWGVLLFAGNFSDRFLSLSQREFWLADTLQAIKTSPFLGVGVHNLMLTISALHPDDPVSLLRFPAHNAYVMMWAEIGIPGLILFLGTYISVVLRSVKSHRTTIVVLGGCLLAMAAIMMFDFYFWADHRSRTLLLWVVALWWGAFLPGRRDDAV